MNGNRKAKFLRAAVTQLMLIAACMSLAYPKLKHNNWCLSHEHTFEVEHIPGESAGDHHERHDEDNEELSYNTLTATDDGRSPCFKAGPVSAKVSSEIQIKNHAVPAKFVDTISLRLSKYPASTLNTNPTFDQFQARNVKLII